MPKIYVFKCLVCVWCCHTCRSIASSFEFKKAGGVISSIKLKKTGIASSYLYGVFFTSFSFILDGVPPDGTPQMIIHTYHIALVAIYYILASGGIVFGVGCLLFNFIFRKRRVIKLTSPNLNYFIVAGAFLMYVSVYIDVLRTTDKGVVYVQCIVHAWLYDIGYLLAFGTILAKMWRVYQIFNNPTPRKKALRDWHLILIIVGVVGIGLIGLFLRSGFQPHPPELVRDNENREGRTPLGVREEYYVWECYEPASGAFYCDLIIFAYLGILQIAGIVLAFQTRKVKISLLNDSMFVAALVYISSLVFLALVLVTFAVRGHINTSAAIFSGGILLLATMFLALTFVPKLINLYRDPQGEYIFDKSNPTNTAELETTGSDVLPSLYNSNNATATLRKKICEQEEEIRDKAKLVTKLQLELSTFKDLQSGSPNTVE